MYFSQASNATTSQMRTDFEAGLTSMRADIDERLSALQRCMVNRGDVTVDGARAHGDTGLSTLQTYVDAGLTTLRTDLTEGLYRIRTDFNAEFRHEIDELNVLHEKHDKRIGKIYDALLEFDPELDGPVEGVDKAASASSQRTAEPAAKVPKVSAGSRSGVSSRLLPAACKAMPKFGKVVAPRAKDGGSADGPAPRS